MQKWEGHLHVQEGVHFLTDYDRLGLENNDRLRHVLYLYMHMYHLHWAPRREISVREGWLRRFMYEHVVAFTGALLGRLRY